MGTRNSASAFSHAPAEPLVRFSSCSAGRAPREPTPAASRSRPGIPARGPAPRPRPPARPRPAPLSTLPGPSGALPAPQATSLGSGCRASRLPRPTQARLTLVRICPDVDTLRISFWGPSCSASLSDESSPVPADAAAGVTAAPAAAAAPPAAPGGWCWPPAPAILSDSCGDTAPPGGGGGGRQWGGSARAAPGAPSLAAAAIFRSSNGPREAGSPGSGAPGLLRAARARAADAVVTMDVEPGPPGTPAHPPRDGIGVLTQNTTSADREDGGDRERDNLQLPLKPGVHRMDGGDEKPPRPPLAGPAVAMLPPSAHWQQGKRAPGVDREPRVSSRLPGVHPATSRTRNRSWEAWASPHRSPNKSALFPQDRRALPGSVSGPPQPFPDDPYLSRPRLGSGSFLRSQPWRSVSGPPPPPSGAHGREEHFPGGSTRLWELFVQKERFLLANRKLGRAWRERRNKRGHAAQDDRMQNKGLS